MCLASQRRSLFRCLHCQNCSGHDFFFQICSCHNKVQFLIPHLDNGCAPTRWLCTRRFGKPTFRPSRRHKTCEKKKNIVFGDCFTFSSICIFCLLTLSLPHFFSLIFANNFFPSVGKHPSIFGNLTCKFPLLKQWPTAWPVQSVKKCTTWWNKNPKGIVPGQTGHKKHFTRRRIPVYLVGWTYGNPKMLHLCIFLMKWKALKVSFFLVFYLVKYRQPSECCVCVFAWWKKGLCSWLTWSCATPLSWICVRGWSLYLFEVRCAGKKTRSVEWSRYLLDGWHIFANGCGPSQRMTGWWDGT